LVVVRGARHLRRRRRSRDRRSGQLALHPPAVQSYPIAYLMLITTVTLDAFALEVALPDSASSRRRPTTPVPEPTALCLLSHADSAAGSANGIRKTSSTSP